MIKLCCKVECANAAVVDSIHICSKLKQQLQGRCVALYGRQMNCLLPAVIRRADVCADFELPLQRRASSQGRSQQRAWRNMPAP